VLATAQGQAAGSATRRLSGENLLAFRLRRTRSRSFGPGAWVARYTSTLRPGPRGLKAAGAAQADRAQPFDPHQALVDLAAVSEALADDMQTDC
jgi:hypothetical protein